MANECRKRKRFSINEKMCLLKEVDMNIGSQKSIAEKFGISTSTLSTILKNRKDIEECAASCGEKAASKRKSVKTSSFSVVEEKLMSWFAEARGKNIAISGPLLQEKAQQIASELDVTNFKASRGWLDNLKKRNNIVHKIMSGEKKSVDPETVEKWKTEILPELIKEYSPSDIFNADETGLFYNLQPDNTLCYQKEKCHGGKKSKLRITVLLAANSDGSEKLRPYVIGKSANPRCFKKDIPLPTKYDANQKSWMNATLFTKWLKDLDRRMRSEKRKIIIFIDQCPAHPTGYEFTNVKVEFFPANCTSELQPLDLGVIRSFKVQYRKLLVRKILVNMEGNSPKKGVNFVNMFEAMSFVRQAWNSVTESTVINCFSKAGFNCPGILRNLPNEASAYEDSDEETVIYDDDEMPEWEDVPSYGNFTEYVSCDVELSTCDTEQKKNEDSESSEDDEETETEFKKVTFLEAVSSLNTLKSYFLSHEVDDSVITKLENIDKELWKIKTKTQKQSSIKDLFPKCQ